MSQDLIVIQFDDAAKASAALQAIREQQKANQIHLNDTAIIRKDADGKVHKVNEVSSATEVGADAELALMPEVDASHRRGVTEKVPDDQDGPYH
jgi:uncharacterized membrane protein